MVTGALLFALVSQHSRPKPNSYHERWTAEKYAALSPWSQIIPDHDRGATDETASSG